MLLHPGIHQLQHEREKTLSPSTLKWKLSSLLFSSPTSPLPAPRSMRRRERWGGVEGWGAGSDKVSMVIVCPSLSLQGPVIKESVFLSGDFSRHFLSVRPLYAERALMPSDIHLSQATEQIGDDSCDGRQGNAAHRLSESTSQEPSTSRCSACKENILRKWWLMRSLCKSVSQCLMALTPSPRQTLKPPIFFKSSQVSDIQLL